MLHRFLAILCGACLVATMAGSQTWVDSVDRHGREVYMPAAQYKWDWGQATFLHSLVHLYHARSGADKQLYLEYVRQAMEVSRPVANGKHPNAVALLNAAANCFTCFQTVNSENTNLTSTS